MKCDLAQQHIIHYVYGELGDEACHELELHVISCESCRNELQVYQALRHAMSLAPVEEPSANLLAQSRIRLEDALDQLPPPTVGMRVKPPSTVLLLSYALRLPWRRAWQRWVFLWEGSRDTPGRIRCRYGQPSLPAQRIQPSHRRRRFSTSAELCSTRTRTWWRCITTRLFPRWWKARWTIRKCRSYF